MVFRRSFCASALVALALLARVDGLYFFVTEGEPRCFLEDVAAETLVIGSYQSPDTRTGEHARSIVVTVEDPRKNKIVTHNTDADGRFAFTTTTSGIHTVCLTSNTTTPSFGNAAKMKFYLRLAVGEDDDAQYETIAKEEHLTALELSVRKLLDKVGVILGEQKYQQERETAFRDTSESTNARVMWFSILQTLILIVAGTWQLRHLKAFFKKKKLV